MKIQILGTGCPKCKTLMANTEAAVKAAGVDAEISKVEKINDIMTFGVMVTPALVIVLVIAFGIKIIWDVKKSKKEKK